MRSPTRLRPAGPRALSGFTLIELLTAITIAVFIMGAVSYIFAQANRVFGAAQGRVQIYQQARAVFDLLERDLQGAVIARVGGNDKYFVGSATTLQFLTTTGSQGADDHSGSDPYNVDLVEVLYHFDTTANKLYRVARWSNTKTPAAMGALTPIPTSGLTDASILVDTVVRAEDPPGTPIAVFAFFQTGSESPPLTTYTVNGGSGGKPPRAVKATLRISDPTGRYHEDVSRTIWIPGGM